MKDYISAKKSSSKSNTKKGTFSDPYGRENVSAIFNAKVKKGRVFSNSRSPKRNLKEEYYGKSRRMKSRLNQQV